MSVATKNIELTTDGKRAFKRKVGGYRFESPAYVKSVYPAEVSEGVYADIERGVYYYTDIRLLQDYVKKNRIYKLMGVQIYE